jgi:hypothetical protein
MAAEETKRLKKARARRKKAETRLKRAVAKAKKNPKSKAAKKSKTAAKRALKKARTAVHHAETGRKAPKKKGGKKKGSKKPKSSKRPKSSKKPKSSKRPKSKKPKAKKKGSKKGGKKSGSIKRQLQAARTRLAKLQAEGKSEKKIAAALRRLRKLTDRKDNQIKKQSEKLAMLQAAEKKKGKKKGKKGRKRNPISGMKENVATFFGVVLAGVMVVGSDRLLAGQSVSSGTDQPPVNGVYDLNASASPIWSNFKSRGWKRTLNAAVQIGLPLFVASRFKRHDAWKTFFQLYGWMAVGLTSAKVTTDVGAKLLGKKPIGFWLYAPEVSAQNAVAASAALNGTAPPAQGIGTSSSGTGNLAYTAPPLGLGKAGECHTGSGQACCASCGCAEHKGVPRAKCGCNTKGGTPGTNQGPGNLANSPSQNGGSTPLQNGTPPGGSQPPNISGPPPGSNSPLAGPTGVQGVPRGSVTPIASRFATSRFDRSKFGLK